MAGFFSFLLVVQGLVAVALIGFILMQRSEGGGLAGGGSPAGMMSARGASDFLTRGTAILATLFVALSILLASLAAGGAIGLAFADADDRGEPGGERGLGLGADRGVALALLGAALAMADDGELAARLPDHRR